MSIGVRLLSTAVKHAAQRPPKRRKLLILGSSVVVVGAAATCYSVEQWEDLTQLGVIRFGRAMITVGQIIVDYKRSLKGLHDTSAEYDKAITACHKRSADRLFDLACVNGGVFIKVGQHIGAMEYLVPEGYTETLSALMCKVPEQNYDDVIYVVEKELGKKVNEIFTGFSKKPVGVASLAQVHVAHIKSTGEKVAVKVQHRRVYENSRTDMKAMEFLANVTDRLFPEFRFMWLVDEVKRNLPKELDFIHEGKNADRVRKEFAHIPFLKIPYILYNYSTPRLLTMEFCEGSHIDDIAFLDKHKISRHDLCKKMGRLISEMIFERGYIHADPHPGNVLINKKPNGQVDIILLDHGLYLTLEDRFRYLYKDLWLALLNADQNSIKRVAAEMGVGELYGVFACIVARRSWKSVTEGIGKQKMNNTEKQELRQYAANLIPQISDVLARMPREMLLILKTNDLLRNIEHILGTSSHQDSMLEMSKCVIRTHHESQLVKSTNKLHSMVIYARLFWALLKIRVFEVYLCTRDWCPVQIL